MRLLCGKVASIDVQLADDSALRIALDVSNDRPERLCFGTVGGRDRARHHQLRAEIDPKMGLVTVDRAALALAPMAHLGFFDRDLPVLCDALPNLLLAPGR